MGPCCTEHVLKLGLAGESCPWLEKAASPYFEWCCNFQTLFTGSWVLKYPLQISGISWRHLLFSSPDTTCSGGWAAGCLEKQLQGWDRNLFFQPKARGSRVLRVTPFPGGPSLPSTQLSPIGPALGLVGQAGFTSSLTSVSETASAS